MDPVGVPCTLSAINSAMRARPKLFMPNISMQDVAAILEEESLQKYSIR